MDSPNTRDHADLTVSTTIEDLDAKYGLSNKQLDLSVLQHGPNRLPPGDLWAATGRLFGISFSTEDIENDDEKTLSAAYAAWIHAQNWAPDAVFGLFGPFDDRGERVYVLLGRGSPSPAPGQPEASHRPPA